MSLITRITDLTTRIGTEFKAVKLLLSGNNTGNLAALNTTAKTHLLEAINEVNTLAGTKQAALGFTPEDAANKGAVNGYPELDGSGKVPLTQMPDVVNKNKGWFTSEAALNTAHATAASGDYASVGTTDTMWLWDADTNAWVDTGENGAVSSVNGFTGDVTLAKADIGLPNVDNTADTAKPVSTAQQAALDAKANSSHGHAISDVTSLQAALDGKAASVHGHSNAIASVSDGFMSLADKAKLDAIAANANNFVHPTDDGNHHVPATGTGNNTKILKSGATAGSESWEFVAFSEITSKPTTISGYGITDVYSKTEIGNPETNLVTAFEAALV